MKAHRTDANHAAIAKALKQYEAAGILYKNVHTLPCFCDMIVTYRKTGALRLCEIKDPAKPPSARKLTAGEMECRRMFPDYFVIVHNVDEILDAVGYDGPRVGKK